MENLIKEFLLDKHPVIIGISSRDDAWGNELFKLFLDKGYQPIPLGYRKDAFLGSICKNDINEIPENSLNVIFSISANEAKKIVYNVEKGKIKTAWFVFGSFSKQIMQLAKEKEINVIHGYCPMMFLNGKGIHKFHYWIKKLFNS
jgi:predicted CoA-binding protein